MKKESIYTNILAPGSDAICVVGAGVGNTVGVCIGAGEIFAVVVIEGKLQHLHTGEAGVGKQLTHVVGYKAKVLGNNFCLGKSFLNSSEQLNTGRAVPFASAGGGIAVGDIVISRKASKMVYTQNIVHTEALTDSLAPPGEAILLHKLPIIYRIAPQLTVGRKAVGGTACYNGGIEFLVQQKLLGSAPQMYY